ncbi:hypothetical protein ACOME3_002132 [Neoechinorhynchus agilis]
MFLALIVAFLNTVGRTNQRIVTTTTSSQESKEDCIRYNVLVESLLDPLSNVDLCGDPLRIRREYCSYMKIWPMPDEEIRKVCFSIGYTLSARCEDRVIYSVDHAQRADIVWVDNYGKYLQFLIYHTVLKIRHILKTRWPKLLRKEVEQTIVLFNQGCPGWRNYIPHTPKKMKKKIKDTWRPPSSLLF